VDLGACGHGGAHGQREEGAALKRQSDQAAREGWSLFEP
jgi:hypothetical protein